MTKAILLNMRDYTIVKEFETMEEAQEAQDLDEFKGFPKHLVNREDWDLTAVDLVKFYNKLTGTDNVKRFENRAIGMARLLAVLNGERLPITDEMAKKAATREQRTGEFHSTTTSATGDDDMATKGKKKGKKTAAKKTARAPRIAKDFTVEATAAGKKDELRMNKESIRTKLLVVIKKHDSIGVDALEKKFPDFSRTNIIGAVRYLSAKGYVRIN